jgi:hypothetical protein
MPVSSHVDNFPLCNATLASGYILNLTATKLIILLLWMMMKKNKKKMMMMMTHGHDEKW